MLLLSADQKIHFLCTQIPESRTSSLDALYRESHSKITKSLESGKIPKTFFRVKKKNFEKVFDENFLKQTLGLGG